MRPGGFDLPGLSVRQVPIGVSLTDIAAGGTRPGPVTEGCCIPRLQVYRVSAQTDRLLVWRSIRCDAPGPNAAQHAGVENISRSFHAHREPQQSTCFGPPRDNSCSRSKDGTYLMRLPGMGGACAPTANTSFRLTRIRQLPDRLHRYLPGAPAAVDCQDCSGSKLRSIRREVEDGGGDVFARAESTNGMLRF